MKIFGTGNTQNDDENVYETEEIEVNYSGEPEEEKGQVALDIIENPNELVIVSPIAGVELEEIDVSLFDGVLNISGKREKPVELYLNGSVLRVAEVFWGEFSRSVILPENLDLDNIKAILEKNILVIRIPKLKFKGNSIIVEKIED